MCIKVASVFRLSSVCAIYGKVASVYRYSYISIKVASLFKRCIKMASVFRLSSVYAEKWHLCLVIIGIHIKVLIELFLLGNVYHYFVFMYSYWAYGSVVVKPRTCRTNQAKLGRFGNFFI